MAQSQRYTAKSIERVAVGSDVQRAPFHLGAGRDDPLALPQCNDRLVFCTRGHAVDRNPGPRPTPVSSPSARPTISRRELRQPIAQRYALPVGAGCRSVRFSKTRHLICSSTTNLPKRDEIGASTYEQWIRDDRLSAVASKGN
jgi:hypothetical protein